MVGTSRERRSGQHRPAVRSIRVRDPALACSDLRQGRAAPRYGMVETPLHWVILVVADLGPGDVLSRRAISAPSSDGIVGCVPPQPSGQQVTIMGVNCRWFPAPDLNLHQGAASARLCRCPIEESRFLPDRDVTSDGRLSGAKRHHCPWLGASGGVKGQSRLAGARSAALEAATRAQHTSKC
jgi:hypothetical protein